MMEDGKSPINIDDGTVCPVRYPPLILNGHWLNDGEAVMVNDGCTAKIILSGDRIPSTISGGPLFNEEYEFLNAHFHWGRDNCNGAEHSINGTWYSMEAHLIHWNRKYLTCEEAEKHEDGLAVLAYFFLVTDKYKFWNNPLLDHITENLKNIVNIGSEVKIPSNALCWIRNAIKSTGYYVYQGSTTTPPFDRDVKWIIFPLITPISLSQMEEFRKLRNEEEECISSNCKTQVLSRGQKIFWAIDEGDISREKNTS